MAESIKHAKARGTIEGPLLDRELEQLRDEVDPGLIDWFRSLDVSERLRVCSHAARSLARLRHAASSDG